MNVDSQDLEGETVYTASGKCKLGEELGSGGEGKVYRVQDNRTSAAKIFNEEDRAAKAEKVRTMIEYPPTDLTYEAKDVRSIIWPEAIIEDPNNGTFLGYLMPYKDLDKVRNAFHYASENLRWDASPIEDRYVTALNLAIAVQAVHSEGHAIGDFNHENILINDGFVTLIDCDAFHITGVDRDFPDDLYFPRYAPPDKRGQTLKEVRKTDRFCLGVHIFQFLMEGNHPYHAKGPDATNGDWEDMISGNPFPYQDTTADVEPHGQLQERYDQLPSEIRNLFENCFSPVAKEVAYGRPKPKEWISTLGEIIGVFTDITAKEQKRPGETPHWIHGIKKEELDSGDTPDWVRTDRRRRGPTEDLPGWVKDNTEVQDHDRDLPDWVKDE